MKETKDVPLKSGWPYLIGLFYLAVLVLLFLGEMWTRPIWLDEELTLFQIKDKSFDELISSFSLGVNAIPYLYFVVVWGLDQVMNVNLFSIRLLSFLGGLVTVLSLHFILRKVLGEFVAFVSICIGLLFIPQFVLYSAEARPYAWLLLLVTLNLATSMNLRTGRKSSYLTNLSVSFLVPSIHYVGLFYSGVLFLVFVFLSGRKGLWSATSFLFGWLLFLILHFGQIGLFLTGDTLVVTDGQATPTLSDFFNMLLGLIQFPTALVIGGCIILGTAWKGPEFRFAQTRDSQFLLLAAAGFLIVPVVFYLSAWIGLPRLTLSRYYYPTCIAGILIMGCCLKWVIGAMGKKSPVWRHGTDLGLIGLVLYLAINSTSAYWPAFGKEPEVLSFRKNLVDDLFIDDAGNIRVIVTAHLHVYFAFYYHYPDLRKHCHLLRPTQREADGWKNFHGGIQSLTPEALTQFEKFTLAYYTKSLNNFPTFDLESWAKSNGFSFAHHEMEPLHGIYRLIANQPR